MTLPDRWLVLRVRPRAHPSASPGADPVPYDELEALVAQGLTDLGGRAVQFDDEGWLLTHLQADASQPDATDTDAWRERVSRAVGLDPEHLDVETSWQEHGDWAELWKRGLEPRRLTSRLIVTPSWCTPEPGPDDFVITVDPGMAFGNAEHGTTRGCLRLLDGLVAPGDRLLDVGAGSAILAIAAALFGAESVEAIEMDELAIPTACENVETNGVGDRVVVRQARVSSQDLAALGPHDGVIANIEAGYLRPLLAGFAEAVRPHGWLLLSGILATEEDAMREATEAHGFTWVETDADGEWRSMHFQRLDGDASAESSRTPPSQSRRASS
jgi:ribosomal protein L11 methyltransferase